MVYDLDTRQIAIEWLQKAIMESLETDGMEDQAGLIMALHEIDYDNSTGHEEFAKRVVEKFVEKLGVTANNARGFLFGGQVDTAPFEAAGYNWKADTYGGNKEFWDRCGISVMEFAAVCLIADEEKGMVRRYKRNALGMLSKGRNGLIVEDLKGVVVIKRKDGV